MMLGSADNRCCVLYSEHNGGWWDLHCVPFGYFCSVAAAGWSPLPQAEGHLELPLCEAVKAVTQIRVGILSCFAGKL